MSVQLKRAYDDVSEDEGIRILVDRIWPRGVSREDLQIDDWMKEVAPSNGLRKWFDHDPEKFETFRERYRKELDEKSELIAGLAETANKQKVTLVFGAKNRKHNQAVVLKEYLQEVLHSTNT